MKPGGALARRWRCGHGPSPTVRPGPSDSESHPGQKSAVTVRITWHSSIAFHLRPIWLQTLVVGSIQNHAWHRFQAFARRHLKSLCYSIRPFTEALLGQVVDLDLLLCTGFNSEHAVLFLCHIFTQRQMADRKIERSDGRCFGRQQLLANSTEIFISHEKK